MDYTLKFRSWNRSSQPKHAHLKIIPSVILSYSVAHLFRETERRKIPIRVLKTFSLAEFGEQLMKVERMGGGIFSLWWPCGGTGDFRMQVVTKRCRLSWLTDSALVYCMSPKLSSRDPC
jgi:hypothetical protein